MAGIQNATTLQSVILTLWSKELEVDISLPEWVSVLAPRCARLTRRLKRTMRYSIESALVVRNVVYGLYTRFGSKGNSHP